MVTDPTSRFAPSSELRDEMEGTNGVPARSGRWPALIAFAIAILVFGVTASLFGASAWHDYVNDQASLTLTSSTTAAANSLDVAIERDADLVATARNLVETTPGITNVQFIRWFRLLWGRDHYPGSFGVVYVRRVPASTTSSASCLVHAAAMQQSGGIGIPPVLSAVLAGYASPEVNYCALPVGAVLQSTAARNASVADPLVSFISGTSGGGGVPGMPPALVGALRSSGLVATITPVFTDGRVPTTESERLAGVQGWVISIDQLNSILGGVLASHPGWSATVTHLDPAGKRTVLAATGTPAAGATRRSYHVGAIGSWVVTLAAPNRSSGLSADVQAGVVALLGLLLTLVLFVLFLVIGRSRARALALVEVRTAELRHRALHDDLTELPNRALVFDRAERMLARAHRNGTDVAALFVDLDGFKDVNDRLGHPAGDELLCQVARRFTGVLRESDTIGRLGGDEFVVLVESAPGSAEPERVAERLLAALDEPFRLGRDGRGLTVASASMGIASGVLDSAEELLHDADIALYEAKASARGSYVVFRAVMRDSVAARLHLEAELREAVAEHQFFLVYQPTVDLADQRITGAEALVRWRHRERGIVMPVEFIPALESTGMIVDVGRFVLFEACRQAAAWRRAGHDLAISVNVSARQLDREDFVDVVRDALSAALLPASALILEITETTLMRNSELSTVRLRALKELGVDLAIDDFGTGYCSLAYLQLFPVDSLKIDQSFVSRMDSSAEGRSLVHAIVQLGKDLNLVTLAEGIETESQLARLRAEECASGQGYLFARPLDPEAMERLIAGQLLMVGHGDGAVPAAAGQPSSSRPASRSS